MKQVVNSDRLTVVLIQVALAALTWLVFGQTLRHDFINYDDPAYVYENPAITGGLSLAAVQWAFTHIHSQNWHPLTTLSHMLDCQLFGVAPAGHHFTNVLLHTCSVLLLFVVLRRMTGAMWRSAFVAAVFAIHPLRVESVAWIAERKDVLSGLFFMLTIAAYTRYAQRGTLGSYLLVMLAFACGLLSKPMLVTAPFVLLLLDYWPLQRFGKTGAAGATRNMAWLFAEKIPLLCLSAGSSIATTLVQKQYIGVGEQLPLSARLVNAAISYVAYMRQMFWPVGLAPFYPHRENTVPPAEIGAAVLLLLAITCAAVVLRRKCSFVPVGWLWYVGMLVPVIGMVQVGWQARADRYTYLPQIGLYVAITWLVCALATRLRISRVTIGIGAAVVVVAFACAGFVQASYWRDSETIWSHTLAVTPRNDVAENNLGIVLLNRGRADEALPHFEAALRLRPDNVPAHTNLANVLVRRGDVAAGVAHARRAVEIEPSNEDARNLLGLVLLQEGEITGAIAEWQKTLDAHPDNGNALSNLAWVYATSPDGRIRDGEQAVRLATRAAQLSGGRNPLVLRTLAAAHAEVGRFDDAVATATRALELARAQNNTGLVAELEPTISLYRSRTPLRDSSLAARTDH